MSVVVVAAIYLSRCCSHCCCGGSCRRGLSSATTCLIWQVALNEPEALTILSEPVRIHAIELDQARSRSPDEIAIEITTEITTEIARDRARSREIVRDRAQVSLAEGEGGTRTLHFDAIKDGIMNCVVVWCAARLQLHEQSACNADSLCTVGARLRPRRGSSVLESSHGELA